MAAIETGGLPKRFGDGVAVQDLDPAVEDGEISGVLGPNDAGTSTTIDILRDVIRAGLGCRPGRGVRDRGVLDAPAPSDWGFGEPVVAVGGVPLVEYCPPLGAGRLRRCGTGPGGPGVPQAADPVDVTPAGGIVVLALRLVVPWWSALAGSGLRTADSTVRPAGTASR